MKAKENLTPTQIANSLEKLCGWELRGKELVRTLKFNDFVEAFGFMTQAARVSEKLNHHPIWTNCYNSVEMRLYTHSSQGITNLDIAWAMEVGKLLSKSGN